MQAQIFVSSVTNCLEAINAKLKTDHKVTFTSYWRSSLNDCWRRRWHDGWLPTSTIRSWCHRLCSSADEPRMAVCPRRWAAVHRRRAGTAATEAAAANEPVGCRCDHRQHGVVLGRRRSGRTVIGSPRLKCVHNLTLSPAIPVLPYPSNPALFKIFDIRALRRSRLSAGAPECQRLTSLPKVIWEESRVSAKVSPH